MKPITPEHHKALNKGLVEAKNLMEMLAIDMKILLNTAFPQVVLPSMPDNLGITKKMAFVAGVIYEQKGGSLLTAMEKHTSDLIRGLCCYVIGYHPLSLEEKLSLVKPLADDPNPGVREWAWTALRPFIIEHLDEALLLLQPWTNDPSERVRRYASEATRPRGVWCPHIRALREEPWKALSLLDNLKADPTRYVQHSVGNWLNDAGKDHPLWVKDLCTTWRTESLRAKTMEQKKQCSVYRKNL